MEVVTAGDPVADWITSFSYIEYNENSMYLYMIVISTKETVEYDTESSYIIFIYSVIYVEK